MALELHLFIQLNQVANITWHDYLMMTPDEARAILQAAEEVLSKVKSRSTAQASFDNLVERYRQGLGDR